MQQKDKIAILFDFDGTLSDSTQVSLQILNKLAVKKNITKISMDFIRNHTSEDILKLLKIKWWELPYYTYIFRKWQIEIEPCPALFPWSKDMLNVAIEKFGETWIISSTDPNRIFNCLMDSDIDLKKINVVGNVGIFSKAKLIKKIIYNEKLQKQNVIYVGDETRDLAAGHKAGINCLGVSWGLQSPQLLKKVNNDLILTDPNQFSIMIEEISKHYNN